MHPHPEMTDLREKLRARRAAQLQSSPEKDGWILAVATLCADVQNWCRPLQDEGLLEVKSSDITVHEPGIGEYTAKQLQFCYPASGLYASLEPRGLRYGETPAGAGSRVSGLHGRVDLASYIGESIPIFRDAHGTWRMFGLLPNRTGTQHPFNEETFAAALLWLLP